MHGRGAEYCVADASRYFSVQEDTVVWLIRSMLPRVPMAVLKFHIPTRLGTNRQLARVDKLPLWDPAAFRDECDYVNKVSRATLDKSRPPCAHVVSRSCSSR